MKKSAFLIMSLLLCGILFTGCASNKPDKKKEPKEPDKEQEQQEQEVYHFGSEQLNQPDIKKYKDHYYTISADLHSIIELDENLKVLPDKLIQISEIKDENDYSWQGYSYRLDGLDTVAIYHKDRGLVHTYDVSSLELRKDDNMSWDRVSSIEGLSLVGNKLYFIVCDNAQVYLSGKGTENLSIQVSELYTYDLETKILECLPSDYNPFGIYVMSDGVYSVARKSPFTSLYRDLDDNESKYVVIRHGFHSEGWEVACELPVYISYMGYTPSIFAQNPSIPASIQKFGKIRNCEVCNAFVDTWLYQDATTHVLTDRYIFHIMSRPLDKEERSYCIPYAISAGNFLGLLARMSEEDAQTVRNMYGAYNWGEGMYERGEDYMMDRYPAAAEGQIYCLLPYLNANDKDNLEMLLAQAGYRKVDYYRDLELDRFSNEEFGVLYVIDVDSMEFKYNVECPLSLVRWLGSNGDNPLALAKLDDGYSVIEVDSAAFEKGEFKYQTLQSGYVLPGPADSSAPYGIKELSLVDGKLIYHSEALDRWGFVPQK